MSFMLMRIIRVAGITVTLLLIPVSILALLALQGVGGEHQIVLLQYLAWAVVNFIAIPFILLGFIIKYTIKVVIYFAVAHLVLSLANLALLLTSTVTGNAVLLAIVALPSVLYIAGFVTHVRHSQQVSPTA